MRKEVPILRKNVYDFLINKVMNEQIVPPVLEIGPMSPEFTPIPEYYVNTKKYFNDKNIEYLSCDIYPDSKCDIICDVLDLNNKLKPESFGTIIALEVMEHTSKIWELPQLFYNLLKPHGKIFISVPYYFYKHAPFPDYWRISDDGLKLLFADKFDINIDACYERDEKDQIIDDRKPIDYTLVGVKKS